MNSEQLRRMSEDKGFIAALDQSGGSTPKALELYGVGAGEYAGEEEMYDQVHAMRTRVMTSPAFDGEHILGVILFENTMRRTVAGLPTPEYLWKQKRIVPFLKIDKGLADKKDGVQVMKPNEGLEDLLEEAAGRGIFGTKMRSVIHDADDRGIAKVVEQQTALAKRISQAGFVPIIEPEVDIGSPSKGKAEGLLKRRLVDYLNSPDADYNVMFKLSLPDEDNFYAELMAFPRVVRVVALSGGYSRKEADEKLTRNKGMIASFSRALLAGLRADQDDETFNRELGAAIGEIYAASVT